MEDFFWFLGVSRTYSNEGWKRPQGRNTHTGTLLYFFSPLSLNLHPSTRTKCFLHVSGSIMMRWMSTPIVFLGFVISHSSCSLEEILFSPLMLFAPLIVAGSWISSTYIIKTPARRGCPSYFWVISITKIKGSKFSFIIYTLKCNYCSIYYHSRTSLLCIWNFLFIFSQCMDLEIPHIHHQILVAHPNEIMSQMG